MFGEILLYQLHSGKYITFRKEVWATESMDDICPYSKMKATTDTFAYNVIFYVSWFHENIIFFIVHVK